MSLNDLILKEEGWIKEEGHWLRGEGRWLLKEISSLFRFKLLFRFPYPKLALFLICTILAYFIFTDALLESFLGNLGGFSYFGVFIAGILFSFGFTAPFSTGFLILMNPENVLLAAIIGGVGCLLGDMIIYKFVKVSFEKEFARLKRERPFRFMRKEVHKFVNPKLWHYFLFALAGFFFASPLIPDEAAVTILAGLSKMSVTKIAIISFVCNTLGILFFLLL